MTNVDPAQLTAADIARLLDLGSRLERGALIGSVDLYGPPSYPDPWAVIARELADS